MFFSILRVIPPTRATAAGGEKTGRDCRGAGERFCWRGRFPPRAAHPRLRGRCQRGQRDGGKVIPWIRGTVSDTGSRELFTLAVLAMALALTVRIFESLGASPEQIDREREHVEASFRGG